MGKVHWEWNNRAKPYYDYEPGYYRRFVTFYISALEILLLTYLLTYYLAREDCSHFVTELAWM